MTEGQVPHSMSRNNSISPEVDSIAHRPSTSSGSAISAKRVESLTPQEYCQAIAFHARQTARQSAYPGQQFEDLSRFLLHHDGLQQTQSVDFATLCTFQGSASVTENSKHIFRHVENLGDPKKLAELLSGSARVQSNSYMLFLAGYSSPEWLATIGSLCLVDPEYYQRHLSFLARQSYFSTPSLPSATNNIITLRITTIGSCHPQGHTQKYVDGLRSDAASQMSQYQHNSRFFKPGDSVVRRFSVHDQNHFSIEQEVSISLNQVEKQWLLLIMLDNGNDLSTSPRGPWLTEDQGQSRWRVNILPTIRHVPNLALNSTRHTRSIEEQKLAGSFPQVASTFRKNYGVLLDPQLCKLDPFYALTELFLLSASSELQFLNMVDEKLGRDTGCAVLSQKIPTLSNLLYHQEILQAHRLWLHDTVNRIKCRGNFQWPGAPEESELSKIALGSANSLLRDFEYLVDKVDTLLQRCDRGMSVMMNKASLAESEKAMEEATRISKLTLLAFFFVPLSFTSSFFGMNFVQFGTSATLGIWLWFAVSVPVLMVSFIFFRWDVFLLLRHSRFGKLVKRF